MKTHFNQVELLHYSRHFNLPEIGTEGQQHLKNARVLYVGAGGLGSSALHYLAATGVGTIGIVDDDRVDASNLQRQVLYSYDEIGCKKTSAAQKRLQRLNPSIQIILHDTRLSHTNAFEIINQYDVIADGSDNFATRYVVNDACFHLKKPHVYASISQFEGQCSIFTTKQGACYRCLFDAPPALGLIPNCAEGGVLGVLPGIMGSIQATEVIKLILGIGKPLINRLLMFDALEMKFRELSIMPNPECRLCKYHQPFDTLPHHDLESCILNKKDIPNISVTELYELQQRNSDFILLDVREPFEYEICNLGGKLIPLKRLSSRISELDKSKHVIVHCKHGVRSRQAVELLNAHGFTNVSHLTGGIIAWIEKMDPTLMKY